MSSGKMENVLYVIRDCGAPCPNFNADEIAGACSSRIDEYVDFMLKFNGGVIPDSSISLGFAQDLGDDMYGSTFPIGAKCGPVELLSYGCVELLPWRDIQKCMSTHVGRISSSSFPIGRLGNDLLLLDRATGEAGVWSRDAEDPDVDPSLNWISVASSFSELLGVVDIDSLEALREQSTYDDPIFQAIAIGDTGALKDIAASQGLDVRRHGGVLMEIAITESRYASVKWLLDNGVSPEVKGERGIPPLVIADAFAEVPGDIIVLLLEYGASAESLDKAQRIFDEYLDRNPPASNSPHRFKRPTDYSVYFSRQYAAGVRTSWRFGSLFSDNRSREGAK